VRTSLRPPKGQLPAKIRATQAKGVQAAAAAAVATMTAATTSKLPSTKIVLRRWMSRIRCFVRTLHTLKAAYTFV
jgi:C4-dicarboxylate-specific signal transduction histidine kinase